MSTLERELPQEGVALCLSGGGFRATLFHIGAFWRLNEFGYLPKLEMISSVSGGSISSAWLGTCWKKLDFDKAGVAGNFVETYVNPLRAFTSKRLDAGIILLGIFNPFSSIGQQLIQSYRKSLFGSLTLQDLPDRPRFVINASNAQSGVLFRFSKEYMGDYRIGMVRDPKIELAVAVAASSAFPPFLSPVKLPHGKSGLRRSTFIAQKGSDLNREPFTSGLVLLDGGVYDNLGLEPIQKKYNTILVSDAGGKMQPEPKPNFFWGVQAFRVLNMMDNQVRALRKRNIMDMFTLRDDIAEYLDAHHGAVDETLLKRVTRKGTYWGTYVDILNYKLDSALDCPSDKTLQLANLPTRLWTFSKEHQERLINWGYACCDAAMRKHVDPKLPNNAKFPYPGGVG